VKIIQNIPETPLMGHNEASGQINRIRVLVQQIPRLTKEEVADELSHIISDFSGNPRFYKVVSEIRNWARDIRRMEWNDAQIRALTNQFRFWSEKLSKDA
jgi:hypothetical protein